MSLLGLVILPLIHLTLCFLCILQSLLTIGAQSPNRNKAKPVILHQISNVPVFPAAATASILWLHTDAVHFLAVQGELDVAVEVGLAPWGLAPI